MPDPGAALKETIVQSAVAAAGFPTPLVRAAGGPDCGLGRAFMVMDRAAGGPLLSGLDGGPAPAAVPRLLRQIPDLLATTMARLHALDPDLVRAELEQVREVPVTVDGLDWSTALLAPRAHDVAFTSLLLSEPPLRVPGWQRSLVRVTGSLLARRLIRSYQRQAGTTVGPGELRWHQAVICLRALTEVASWVHQDVADAHVGHPWLVSGPALARRLAALTGAPVRPR